MAAGNSFDLVPRILPYLDRLLIFALLEHASEQKLYSEDVLLQAKFDLMKDTNMADYVTTLHKKISGSDAEVSEYVERREKVLEKLAAFEKESAELLQVLRNPDVVAALRPDRAQNIAYLKENHNVR